MKKFIFTFLLMAMTLVAGAYNEYWANGIRYEIVDENTVKVAAIPEGYNNYSGVLTIPQTAKITVNFIGSHVSGSPYARSYRVTEIGDGAFRDCTGLTGIVLPNTITRIGDNAFYGCTGLTSVTIPNTVKSIGASAFGYCTSLSSIVVPNSVGSIGWNLFYGCTSLTSVTLPDRLQDVNGTFKGCTALTSITVPKGVRKLDATFTGCSNLSEVILPLSLFSIDNNAFDGCTSLTHIDLPNTVTTIGNRAFANTGLTELELPDCVTKVGEDAFYGSTSLTSVSLRATEPPLMANSGAFSFDTYGNASLHVPEASLSSYRSTDWWRVFMNITADETMNNPYDFEADGIYYKIIDSNTVEVTFKDRTYNSYSGELNIPASVIHDGVTYQVTGIGNSAFKLCTALTTVNLPATITRIGKQAFYNSGLTDISLPESVTCIGDSAYMACSKLNNLASLTIPRNVSHIGFYAFSGVKMNALTWNARDCWYNGNMTTDYINQLTIGDDVVVLPPCLAQYSNIRELVLPNTLTTICNYALYGINCTEFTMPENVVTIEDQALYCPSVTSLTWNARECWSMDQRDYGPTYQLFSNVTDLTIGNEVTVIPQDFVYTARISSVNIPESVKYIGPYAFNDCDSLKNIVIPDGVEEIGPSAFYRSPVTDMTIGKNVKVIGGNVLTGVTNLTWNATECEAVGDYAQSYYYYSDTPPYSSLERLSFGENVKSLPGGFGKKSQLKSLEFPPSLQTINDNAFSSCEALSEISIPGSVKTIAAGAFSNCPGLTNVSIPASVTSLRGFENCDNLTKATISAPVVGDSAFWGCDQLTNLKLKAPVESIGYKAFASCPELKTLNIPNTVTSIVGGAFSGCSGLSSIVVAKDNPVYDSRDNCNAVVETANDALVLTCKNTVMPSQITAIGDYAFYNRYDLTSFEIPSTVTSIGKYAFGGCSGLTQMNIPEGVTSLGEGAFSGCYGLTSVNIPAGVTTISDRLFNGCNNLTGITIPDGVTSIGSEAFKFCNKLSSVNIPAGVTEIKDRTFSCCRSLADITIPNGVTRIGYGAFEECQSLTSVTIPESVNTIGTYAFYYCYGLNDVYALASTPPAIDCEEHHVSYGGGEEYDYTDNPYYTFYRYYYATLHVPEASMDAYKAADAWKEFRNVVSLAKGQPGDVDGDGAVTINDTAVLIGLLINGDIEMRTANMDLPGCADVNGDGQVNIEDVTSLINMMLTSE